jgi:transposase
MRYLSLLSAAAENELASFLGGGQLLEREKKRFTAVYPNTKHRASLSEPHRRLGVSVNTIHAWFDKYESGGLPALLDQDHARRPGSLDKNDPQTILSAVAEQPRSIRQAAQVLARDHRIQASPAVLKRYLKKRLHLQDGLQNP